MRKHVKSTVHKKGEKKVNEITAFSPVTTELNVNLCDGGDFRVTEEFMINYMDLGSQVMILDMGALVSLAVIQWLEQPLGEFDLTTEEMESSPCN